MRCRRLCLPSLCNRQFLEDSNIFTRCQCGTQESLRHTDVKGRRRNPLSRRAGPPISSKRPCRSLPPQVSSRHQATPYAPDIHFTHRQRPATRPLPRTLPSHSHAPQTREPQKNTTWTTEPRTTLCRQQDQFGSRHTCPNHRRQKPQRQRHVPSNHRRPRRRRSSQTSARQHSTFTHTNASKEHAIDIQATAAHDADYCVTYAFAKSTSATKAPPLRPPPRPTPPQPIAQINLPAAQTRATDAHAADDNNTDDRRADPVAAAPSPRRPPPHNFQRLTSVPTKFTLQTPRAPAHMASIAPPQASPPRAPQMQTLLPRRLPGLQLRRHAHHLSTVPTNVECATDAQAEEHNVTGITSTSACAADVIAAEAATTSSRAPDA